MTILLVAVSHVNPGIKPRKHRRSDCRKGLHEYGEPQNIGAGILRRVCDACAAVTIDLTQAGELTAPLVSTRSNIIEMTARHSTTI